jgi:hypothetical protein
MSDEYKVGYGKPPKKSQFRKGQSGNPKGRPKGSKNVGTFLMEELMSSVTLSENGRPTTVPKAKLLAKRLIAKAANGDMRAIAMTFELAAKYQKEEPAADNDNLPEEDDAILAAYLARHAKRPVGAS